MCRHGVAAFGMTKALADPLLVRADETPANKLVRLCFLDE